MSNIVGFPKHVLSGNRCQRCLCRGKRLTTECPGEPMNSIYHLCIEDGSLDYQDGAWKFTGWDDTAA